MTIKELRQQTGLTQQKFAEKFHMRVDNVRCWEQEVSHPLDCIPWMVERILKLEEQEGQE